MKNEMKKIILTLTAAAALAGCAKQENVTPSEGRDIVAQSTHRMVNAGLTREAYIGTISAGNPLNARVLTFAEDESILCDGYFAFTTGSATAYNRTSLAVGTGKYPADADLDDYYYMVGLYPQATWTGDASAAGNTVEHPITGCADIMVAEMQTLEQEDVLDSNAPKLIFRHQLTKFEVKVKARDEQSQEVWAEVKSINLKAIADYDAAMPTTFGYVPDGGTKLFTGTSGPITFYTIDNTGAAAAYTDDAYAGTPILDVEDEDYTDETVAYVIAAPFMPTNAFAADGVADIQLVVVAETADGEDETFELWVKIPYDKLPVGATNSAGMGYTITLTFADKSSIVAEAEVIDWVDGGDTENVLM